MASSTHDEAIATARQLHDAGRLAQAERIYREVLAQDPNHPDALNLLGVLMGQAGHPDWAVEMIRRALAIKPGALDYLINLGYMLHRTGQCDRAIAVYLEAIRLEPGLVDAYVNLSDVLLTQGEIEQAITAARHALQLAPNFAKAHNNLGIGLVKQEKITEAIAAFRQSVALQANDVGTWKNLAMALAEDGQLDQALATLGGALALRPNYPDAHNDRGSLLEKMGRYDEAFAAFQRSIYLRPDFSMPHFNLGMALLRNGDFDRGWREFEWRWRTEEFTPFRRNFPQPQWEGEELAGRCILLSNEQAFGDMIMFARFVPLVAQRGGKIVLECRPELARLFADLPHVERMIVTGQPLGEFDLHCPLLSVPRRLQMTLATIPAAPYLRADENLAAKWRERLSSADGGLKEGQLKVGLSWAGRRRPDPNRSIDPSFLAALAQVPGVWFCSLQKQLSSPEPRGSPEPQALPPGLKLTDWTDELGDFADTAALIANLDLVLTIDTATAHLAGAMGKRVWVLLPAHADWRWMRDRDDSPWYPTMRLFRQPVPGDWQTPVEQVAQALQALAV